MSEPWALPGFQIEELLGSGATGEVWRARELASGDPVALKRLRPGADLAAVEALRREAALLRVVDTPYVVRLRDVLGEGASAVLVLDYAAGGSLAALLARRGQLEPGEVVTVGVPIASALAAAHARGLVHGDVSPANVLFTAHGMPLLTDLGIGRVSGQGRAEVDGTAEYVDPAVVAGGTPDPASDVWALAALCHHCLSGSPPHEGHSVADVLSAAADGFRAPLGLLAPHAPRALVAVLEGALAASPARRPTAAAFAEAVQRALAPAPVRLTGAPPAAAPVPPVRDTHPVPRRPVPPPAPPRGRRLALALPSVPVLAGLAVVAALLGVGLTWALTGGQQDAPTALAPVGRQPPTGAVASAEPPAAVPALPPDSPEPTAASVAGSLADWVAVLDGLDRDRERAFATGDAALLARIYTPTSGVQQADAASLAFLTEQGRRATGVRHEVRSLEVLAAESDRVELRVIDVLGPQTVLDAADEVLEQRAGRSEASYDVVLVRADGRWRIAELLPA